MNLRLCLLLYLASLKLSAQLLTPGFDPEEYRQLLLISTRIIDSEEFQAGFAEPAEFKKIYRSPQVGLDNLWELWIHEDKNVAVISIRGTNASTEGWLLNFYAAMVPAKGVISWGEEPEQTRFEYELSDNPDAAVHVGWLVGTAFLYQDMKPKLDSLYQAGIKDYFITGHSQGGGISYMLTAYLRMAQKRGKLPSDIQWKTYCSAAPKPGNLPFAYSYEAMTQNGWAFNMVNARDWVPEVPFSVQTLDDFNPTNPFVNVEEILDQQKFSRRVILKHIYNKLDKPTRKAQQNFEKFLGEMTQKLVKETIPGLSVPDYYHSNNYVRTGIQIVMTPDSAYYAKFPYRDSADAFTHHGLDAYLYLIDRLNTPFYKQNDEQLRGRWLLDQMPGEALDSSAFAGDWPYLEFHPESDRVTGYAGCNGFSARYELKRNGFVIGEAMTTGMFCDEENRESEFLSHLQGHFNYRLEDKRLLLTRNGEQIFTFRAQGSP